MPILVVNPMNDVHCRHMVAKLKEMGLEYKELGSPQLNDYAAVNGELIYNGEPLRRLRSVYFRSIMTHNPNQLAGGSAAERYNSQLQFSAQVEAVRGWLHALHEEGARVINPPSSSSKYYQLNALHRAGIPLPRTCITSNSEIARNFISQVKGAVCKPLPGGSYCRKVTPDLLEQLEAIHNEPTIFQEEIPGDDVRINMLAGKVISAHKIIKSNPDILDYRTDPDYHSGEVQYESVELPKQVVQFCARAMQLLGLRFSGIDLRRTPDGEFVLIECNSMPAFLDIELKTGAMITASLIEDMQQAPLIDRSSSNFGVGTYARKKGTANNSTLFDYYDVMSHWSKQARKLKDRIIVDLNEEQKEQMLEQTGSPKAQMELEIQDGKVKVLRVW
ncbi:ATP-grasp domain-containing protein [Paenibacillus bouchesdurhonensis]|uniref:ATP-grasp domain-containing protein n=1 Tax=Paenibacillus bouchesdurhonensis TaxID=1870990 RepID=UPI000DA5F4F2|nr:ATP-grasp domain-containing protein [Paenibacillus bouchesdurhonensis]